MDRKNTKKSVVERSKSQRVKARDIPNSPDSSSSVETDEDYAEFLKTYNPRVPLFF
jgi:hypothetical protein